MTGSVNDAVTWKMVDPQVMGISLRSGPANALGPRVIEGLDAALDEADGSGGVKVVIVSSEVHGFFAAGADIKHMKTVDAEAFADYGTKLRNAVSRFDSQDRVSIAALEGLALGGGLELALACTLRVASSTAHFGLPEVKLGLIPGAGGTQRLPRLVGRGHALDIMLTARQIDAEEALRIGLIDRVVSEGCALDTAIGIAQLLCSMSMPALRSVVRSVEASAVLPLGEGLVFEAKEEQQLFEIGEAREGLNAFLERRAPVFS